MKSSNYLNNTPDEGGTPHQHNEDRASSGTIAFRAAVGALLLAIGGIGYKLAVVGMATNDRMSQLIAAKVPKATALAFSCRVQVLSDKYNCRFGETKVQDELVSIEGSTPNGTTFTMTRSNENSLPNVVTVTCNGETNDFTDAHKIFAFISKDERQQ